METPDKDLVPEYDFSKGVRGKYATRATKASDAELSESMTFTSPCTSEGKAQEAAPSDVQDAWNKEIERRIAAHERGEMKVYDLDEVMDEARRLAL
jgi:hypothetical protein